MHYEEIAHLVDGKDDERHLQMYLHRKFYDIAHILNVRLHLLGHHGYHCNVIGYDCLLACCRHTL